MITEWQTRQWQELRDLYDQFRTKIETGPHQTWVCDPYHTGWLAYASPIEKIAWSEIRQWGAVLYPQYPIEKYFADFAHPKLKVILELDGAAYHNAKQDEQRNTHLTKLGWTIYRVPGRECKVKADPDHIAEKHGTYSQKHYDETQRWAEETVGGVIAAITHKYFRELVRFEPGAPDAMDKFLSFKLHCFNNTLIYHNAIN